MVVVDVDVEGATRTCCSATCIKLININTNTRLIYLLYISALALSYAAMTF